MITNLSTLTEFVRKFAEFHPEILHTEKQAHFSELLNDGLTVKLKNAVFAPFIAMQRLTVEYSNTQDNQRKTMNLRLFFMQKIQDAGNFESVLKAKNDMEAVAEDFIKSLFANRRNFKCEIDSINIDYIEETNLTGVILETAINIPFNQCNQDNIFILT